MPRFVILEHDHPELHWDLMLEAGNVLHTWRLAQPPAEPACVIAATALPDHRMLYLDYEGPVSGDRGTVSSFDRGEYSLLTDDRNFVEILLRGNTLRGRAELKRIPEFNQWEFHYTPDPAY